MCNCDREKQEVMEETVEEIKALLDEIVCEAREKLSEKKEQEEKTKSPEDAWKKVKMEMMMKINLSDLSDAEYDKDNIAKTIDKALPEILHRAIVRILEDNKR